MSDVLINFVGDTTGLDPVDQKLTSIIDKSTEVGQAWEKTGKSIEASQNKSNSATDALSKTLDNLVTASKTLDKSIVGGAYTAYLKELQKQLGLTQQELIKYVNNARKSAVAEILNPNTTEDVKQMQLSVEVMNETLEKLGVNLDSTSEKNVNLRTELLNAKEAFADLIKQGVDSGPVFDAAKAKLEELAKQTTHVNEVTKTLGSDTKSLNGFIELATTGAAAFETIAGAEALFGDESEDVHKALLKLNAAMAILQGLQEIQRALSKESAASLLLESLFYLQKTVAVVENTVATEANAVATTEATVASEANAVAAVEQTAATEAATVAQVELNVAMELNPVALLIAGFVALTAALIAFSNTNRFNEEIQRDANQAILEGTTYLDFDLKSREHYINQVVANAKLQGKTAAEVTAIEGNEANERLQVIDKEREKLRVKYNEQEDQINQLQALGISVDKDALAAHTKLLDTKFELDKKYQDESSALLVKKAEFDKLIADGELKAFIQNEATKVLATRAGSDAERIAQIQEIRATQDDRIKLARESAATVAEANSAAANIIAQDQRSVDALNLQNYQHYLNGRTSLFEAYAANAKAALLRNQVDTIASINKVTDADIEAAKKKRDQALKGDPNQNLGETKKIVAESNLAILELEQSKQSKLLEIQKAGIQARLDLANKGSFDEYRNRIALNDQEQLIALKNTELTAEQVQEIKNKHDKAGFDLSRQYDEQLTQNRISLLDGELAEVDITEQKKLTITLKRIEEQRDLEISQAEQNADKIVAINAKADAAIIESKRNTQRAILAEQIETITVFTQKSVDANNRILDSNKTSPAQKEAALKALQKFNDDKFDIEEAELLRENLSEKDYNLKHQDLLNKREESEKLTEKAITDLHRKAIEERNALLKSSFDLLQQGLDAVLDTSAFKTALTGVKDLFFQIKDILNSDITDAQKRNEIIIASVATAQAAVNQIFADAAAQRAQALTDEINTLEDAKQQELSAENLTAQQKTDINNRYREKEKQAKRQAFIADKDAKKEQAVINGILAASNALATYPWPYSLIVAAIVGGIALAEVAEINATPVPNFRGGVVGIKGPGTGTSDSIRANISNGESIVTADATSKWADALQAMNANNFDEYMQNRIADFVFPYVPAKLPRQTGGEIDHDKLATAIANKMKGVIPRGVTVHNTMDENGFTTHMATALTDREILNNYLRVISE